jgi:hypothetical protein
MKRIKLIFLIILLIFVKNIFATFTRVKSLGDIENPVDNKISGLIKDDIVDIYFNPAKVNEIKNYLIFSAFNLKYGSELDEYLKFYEKTDTGVQTNETTIEQFNRRYDFKFNTGVIIPLQVFNIFIDYNPNWLNFNSEDRTLITQKGLTNSESKTTNYTKENLMAPLPFNIVLGLKFDNLLLGLKSGFAHSEYSRFSESEGIKEKKAEYKSDEFSIGSGIEFNFNKKLSLSLAGDFNFSQKDDFPLYVPEDISSSNDLNYDKQKGIYNYNYTEKVSSYNLRIYPELRLENERFFRFLLGINYLNYSKSHKFNPQGDYANFNIKDFSKNEVVLSSGVSYNYNFTQNVMAIYGIKYTGYIYSREEKLEVSKNNEIENEKSDHFIGGFSGFESKVSPMVFIRVGISQGFYRFYKVYEKIYNKLSGDITEKYNVNNQFLPQTVFGLGLYVNPVKNLIFELNFIGMKDWTDWDMENISISEEQVKVNGVEKEKITKNNYDFQIGVSITYRI